jgi:uncharacterized protein YbcI
MPSEREPSAGHALSRDEPMVAGGDHGAAGELNAEVAHAIVRIYRGFRGRGPSKARALFRDDVLVVVLEDVMTSAERSLADNGRTEDALRMRRQIHEIMRPELIRAAELITGTTVRALVGESEADPDVAVEVFLMNAPLGKPALLLSDEIDSVP